MNEENILQIETQDTLETKADSTAILSVSGGNAVASVPAVVSGGDILSIDAVTTALAENNDALISKFDTEINQLNCIIFLILGIWIIERLRSACERWCNNGKTD